MHTAVFGRQFKKHMLNKNNKLKKQILELILLILCMFLYTGCADQTATADTETTLEESEEESLLASNEIESEIESMISEESKEPISEEVPQSTESEETMREEAILQTGVGTIIAIDAGHQQHGNNEKEPIGPGASEMKAKVSGGTSGVASGLAEYELNLEVSLKLKEALINRGYEVFMIREENDVNISNAERAQLAYEAGADILVRIHANGSADSSVNGAMTICQTNDNPYVSFYEASKKLSTCILDAMVATTGAHKEYVWETDSMSGINWSMMPVTIVEMGYMTNPDEDLKMATDDYQAVIANGIADGIDLYYENAVDN